MPAGEQVFEYRVQTSAGHALTGDIRAADGEVARAVLESSGLIVNDLRASPGDRPAGALSGADFQAFNQQLAFLADSGLPTGAALEVIASDMRSGRLASTIRAVAAEIDRGASLSEAFEKHGRQFPYGYAELVAAGIAAGTLPGVLWGLARHLQMRARLAAAMWRAAAYPLVVLLTLVVVLSFIGMVVAPQFDGVFSDFDVQMPALTAAMLAAAEWSGVFLAVAVAVLLGGPLLWRLARPSGVPQWVRDRLVVPLPLVGRGIRSTHVARWCDSLRLGVMASMPMPEALRLAASSSDSSVVRADCDRLIHAVESGQEVRSIRLRMLPEVAVATLALAADGGDLAGVLHDLAGLYEQEAETRLNAMQLVLSPILLVCVAATICVVLMAMFLPLVRLMQSVM
ncbi:MAG: type II secretion system F family protein [Planctomycetota bacterium]